MTPISGRGARLFKDGVEIQVRDLVFLPGELRYTGATVRPLATDFEVEFSFIWNETPAQKKRRRELTRRRLRRVWKKAKHRQWLRARQ